MKKLLFAVTVMTLVVAGAAGGSARQTADSAVERAIDTRLHQLLLKLNAEKK